MDRAVVWLGRNFVDQLAVVEQGHDQRRDTWPVRATRQSAYGRDIGSADAGTSSCPGGAGTGASNAGSGAGTAGIGTSGSGASSAGIGTSGSGAGSAGIGTSGSGAGSAGIGTSGAGAGSAGIGTSDAGSATGSADIGTSGAGTGSAGIGGDGPGVQLEAGQDAIVRAAAAPHSDSPRVDSQGRDDDKVGGAHRVDAQPRAGWLPQPAQARDELALVPGPVQVVVGEQHGQQHAGVRGQERRQIRAARLAADRDVRRDGGRCLGAYEGKRSTLQLGVGGLTGGGGQFAPRSEQAIAQSDLGPSCVFRLTG
jgi:hypothetical protein